MKPGRSTEANIPGTKVISHATTTRSPEMDDDSPDFVSVEQAAMARGPSSSYLISGHRQPHDKNDLRFVIERNPVPSYDRTEQDTAPQQHPQGRTSASYKVDDATAAGVEQGATLSTPSVRGGWQVGKRGDTAFNGDSHTLKP